MQARNGTPYITLTGKSAPRSDDNICRFECVTAIIRNKDTGLYLALEFIKQEFGLVGGKVESGEEKNIAMVREVEEETGYKCVQIIRVLFEHIYGRGYKARKNREEEGLDRVFIIEVEEKNKSKILGSDIGTKGVFWFTGEEMLERLTLDHHMCYFEEYFNNK